MWTALRPYFHKKCNLFNGMHRFYSFLQFFFRDATFLRNLPIIDIDMEQGPLLSVVHRDQEGYQAGGVSPHVDEVRITDKSGVFKLVDTKFVNTKKRKAKNATELTGLRPSLGACPDDAKKVGWFFLSRGYEVQIMLIVSEDFDLKQFFTTGATGTIIQYHTVWERPFFAKGISYNKHYVTLVKNKTTGEFQVLDLHSRLSPFLSIDEYCAKSFPNQTIRYGIGDFDYHMRMFPTTRR